MAGAMTAAVAAVEIRRRVTKKVVTTEEVTKLQVCGNRYTTETRTKTTEEFMDGYGGRAVAVYAGSAPKKLTNTAIPTYPSQSAHRKTLKEASKPKTADNKVKVIKAASGPTSGSGKGKTLKEAPKPGTADNKVKVIKAASGPTSGSGKGQGGGGGGGGGLVKLAVKVKVVK